jgi:peptide-methionine (S)-S-oxide reductase
MDGKTKIALGGGCHWCTEAVFQSLKGVEKVEQGYVASNDENRGFSEAVIVHFNSDEISLKALVEIHLYTHKSTVNHSMREKYRSAIYCFSKAQVLKANEILIELQKDFKENIITKVYPFNEFRASREAIQNYYQTNPNKPFCKAFIEPKLRLILEKFSKYSKPEKLNHLMIEQYEEY